MNLYKNYYNLTMLILYYNHVKMILKKDIYLKDCMILLLNLDFVKNFQILNLVI